jgi:hypothetical protein
VLECAEAGPVIADGGDALEVIAHALGQRIDVVVLPVGRIDERFFSLSSGIAGDVAQKFVTYHTRLVIVGDISRHTARSGPLRDFVYETNRHRQLWFVADDAELQERLSRG